MEESTMKTTGTVVFIGALFTAFLTPSGVQGDETTSPIQDALTQAKMQVSRLRAKLGSVHPVYRKAEVISVVTAAIASIDALESEN